MKLRINGKGSTGRSYHVWLDDVEQDRVVDVVLSMGVGEINMARITYLVDEIDVDVETEVDPHSSDGEKMEP